MIDERERLERRMVWLKEFRKHYTRQIAIWNGLRANRSRLMKAGVAFRKCVSWAAEKVREFGREAEKAGRTYRISHADGRQTITCLVCGMTSYNENDVNHRFCGHCNKFHDCAVYEDTER